jgi:hypothetical protein
MTPFEEKVIDLHRALYEALGLPKIRPSISDQRLWHDFLREMEPLAETDHGPFTEADIGPVIRHMQWEKREGKSGWSLRPFNILSQPEVFRDLVLITRQKRQPKKLKAESVKAESEIRSQKPVEDPMTEEEFNASIARMRAGLRGGAA